MNDQAENSGNESDAERYISRENCSVRERLAGQDAAELKRRRDELTESLLSQMSQLTADRQAIEDALADCRSTIENLAELECSPSDLVALRTEKRLVQEAEVKLLKLHQNRNMSQNNGHKDLESLSFSQLSRIGFAIMWPLLLIVAASFAVLIATILVIFKV